MHFTLFKSFKSIRSLSLPDLEPGRSFDFTEVDSVNGIFESWSGWVGVSEKLLVVRGDGFCLDPRASSLCVGCAWLLEVVISWKLGTVVVTVETDADVDEVIVEGELNWSGFLSPIMNICEVEEVTEEEDFDMEGLVTVDWTLTWEEAVVELFKVSVSPPKPVIPKKKRKII